MKLTVTRGTRNDDCRRDQVGANCVLNIIPAEWHGIGSISGGADTAALMWTANGMRESYWRVPLANNNAVYFNFSYLYEYVEHYFDFDFYDYYYYCQPVIPSIRQCINNSVSHSVSHSVSQSISQSENHSIYQPVTQYIPQSASRSVNP